MMLLSDLTNLVNEDTGKVSEFNVCDTCNERPELSAYP